jgi:hypothetical protein
MAEPLTHNIPSGEITLGTTLTQLTGDTSRAETLTILEASAGADIRVALGPGLEDGGAAPANYVPIPEGRIPYPVAIRSHGFVALFTGAGSPTCRVIVETP